MARQIGLLLVVLTVHAGTGPAWSQISEYVVHSGDEATFSVIRNGVILRQWPTAPGTDDYQYPLVVRNGNIRTMGADPNEFGAEYDPNGLDLGTRFVHPVGPSKSWDGTSDANFNYTIDTSGRVWRLDPNWASPQQLFLAGSIGALAYDAKTDSLWVSQFSTQTITNYTLGGQVLSSFSTGHTQNMALAIDPADDTLWLHDRNVRGTFEQWTKSGTRLQRIAVPGMEAQNALAGEFRFRKGDLNCDGQINFGDINPFVLALSDPNAYKRQYPDCDLRNGDINNDGAIDFGDINPFVGLLSGAGAV